MEIADQTNRNERLGLWVSLVGSLMVGGVGVTFSLLSDSQAILLDGLFNLSYFATALFTLKVASLLKRGESEEFPMGYAFFEPLVNGVKGLLILGVSLLALVGAVEALFAGGRAISAGLATVYGGFAAGACWIVALITRRQAKQSGSPLVQADADSWIVNAAISSAVLLTFITLLLIRGTAWEPIAPYVDPLLVIVVVLISLGVPIRMAWRALMEFLNRTPSAGLLSELRGIIWESLRELPVRQLIVRVVQPGRTRIILAHVVLPTDFSIGKLAELDRRRAQVEAALKARHLTTVVDLVFTTDSHWCALDGESREQS
jgi:predicted Co/Zn/Cd cation transporter (cation efflux family)